MICFYHADNDGKCAGYWVDKCGLLDEHGKTFFKIDYGIDFPFDKIHHMDHIIIRYKGSLHTNRLGKALGIV